MTTKLQKAMAKYAGRPLTLKDFNQMKIDACLLIGDGITDNYYEKTFGAKGSIKTIKDAEKFANDAEQGIGSFNYFAITQYGRHHRRKVEKDDEQ